MPGRKAARIGRVLSGGAVATHVRVGSPRFTHILFGVYLGLIAWGVSGSATRASAR